jgi:RNA polymerase sigma factor (sigma-70 family)
MYRYEKAVDIVNDGFVKLFNHFPVFKISAASENEKILLAWLKKIMVNTAIDELRKEQLLPEIGGMPESDWAISNQNDDADQSLLYKDLIILIKELPPTYRIVFNLYVIDGFTHCEIAEMMNTSVGTSKSSLSRARALLRKKIKNSADVKACTI